jgi:hypothetical protein
MVVKKNQVLDKLKLPEVCADTLRAMRPGCVYLVDEKRAPAQCPGARIASYVQHMDGFTAATRTLILLDPQTLGTRYVMAVRCESAALPPKRRGRRKKGSAYIPVLDIEAMKEGEVLDLHCVVIGLNPDGVPDFFPCVVVLVTPLEYQRTNHYAAAERLASEAGWEPSHVLDQNDPQFSVFRHYFTNWKEVPRGVC